MSMLKQHGKKRQINELDDKRNNKRQQSDNEQISSSTNFQKCLICNRNFTQTRLIEHQQACEKSKKLHANSLHRYHYDSRLHRWKGLDYQSSANRSNAQRHKHFPKTHWREKHQQFQDALKGQYNPTNDFVQSSLDDRPYQCSQCQRKFATENAITKHQKGCRNNRWKSVKSCDRRNKSVKY